jgi:hypothetical protein
LDRQTRSYAFLKRTADIFTVRDTVTGETFETALDAVTGQLVDLHDLARRERVEAGRVGGKLAPELRDLLVRHPDLARVSVRIFLDGTQGVAVSAEAREQIERLGIDPPDSSSKLEVSLPPAEIIELATNPLVRSLQLAEEPVILDRFQPVRRSDRD